MAEDVEKTEEPTPRKRARSRREGQIAISQDFYIVANVMFVALTLVFATQWTLPRAIRAFPRIWAPRDGLTVDGAVDLLKLSFATAGWLVVPVLLAALVAGLVAGFAQTRGQLTLPRAKPKPGQLNPTKNLSRIFKKSAPIELPKTILKILIAAGAVWFVIEGRLEEYLRLPELPLASIMAFQLTMVAKALVAASAAMIIVAIIDYAWQHYQTEKSMKMTKSEVKDETRQAQGDPEVRKRLLGQMFERSLRRMMGDVPQADVVVTNPEHISIALRYTRSEMAAPEVVAKGAGFVALKIRTIARECGVPIVENKPLARALYRGVKVGQHVPERLFQAVAEVLAYVYRLDRARGSAW